MLFIMFMIYLPSCLYQLFTILFPLSFNRILLAIHLHTWVQPLTSIYKLTYTFIYTVTPTHSHPSILIYSHLSTHTPQSLIPIYTHTFIYIAHLTMHAHPHTYIHSHHTIYSQLSTHTSIHSYAWTYPNPYTHPLTHSLIHILTLNYTHGYMYP